MNDLPCIVTDDREVMAEVTRRCTKYTSDLRHTAATRMADAGADPFTLAAILGHSDIRMAARYTHATDEAKRRAVDRLVAPISVETRPLPQAVLTARDTHAIVATGASETPALLVNALPLKPTVNAVGSKIFGNVLATETKMARSA